MDAKGLYIGGEAFCEAATWHSKAALLLNYKTNFPQYPVLVRQGFVILSA